MGNLLHTKNVNIWIQERNANFYQGAIAMTALGMVVNELKQVQYGYEKKQNITQMIAEGMDRAGLFTIVSDINHALEVMSSNRVSSRCFSWWTSYRTKHKTHHIYICWA